MIEPDSSAGRHLDQPSGAGGADELTRSRDDAPPGITYALRRERFTHGDCVLETIMPRNADLLIDEEAFSVDEHLPYWVDLWPSALALARHLLEAPLPEGPVVELGCGLALPSLVMRCRGVDVLATDLDPEGLRFATWNAARNGLAPLRTAQLDWRHPAAVRDTNVLLAADVLYEERHAVALAEAVPGMLRPGGTLLLADPGRRWLPAFLDGLDPRLMSVEPLPRRIEIRHGAAGAVPVDVRLFACRRRP